jgi:membrane protease YdiL (CAAX protease family)
MLNARGHSIDVSIFNANERNSITNSLGIYLYYFIIGPIIEELLFRGGILEGLKKYGITFAIMAQALIFAFMHNNLMQIVLTLVAGILYGYIAVMTESVLVAILIHIINNSFSGLIQATILKNADIASPIYIIMSTLYVIIGILILYSSKWKITLGNTINIDIKEFFSRNKQQKIRRGKYEP